MSEYIQYMSNRELKERRAELQEYIDSGYCFLYDDSIEEYSREVLDSFGDEIDEINEELGRRIDRVLELRTLQS